MRRRRGNLDCCELREVAGWDSGHLLGRFPKSRRGTILAAMEPARSFGGAALRVGLVICGFAIVLALALGSVLVAVPVFLCLFAPAFFGRMLPPPAAPAASPGSRRGSRSRAPPVR